MKKTIILLLTLFLILGLVVSGCSNRKTENSPTLQNQSEMIKVAFVYDGPVGDMGWSFCNEMGRIYLEKELPYVTTTKVERVSANDQNEQERVFTKLAQENNIIFATSSVFKESLLNVAEKFPNVYFLNCSSTYKTVSNLTTYGANMGPARYLTGIVAGKMTKTNTVGFLATFPTPMVFNEVNAFALGVRSVNPNARIKVEWSMSWYDPVKEKCIVNSLLDAGADIIAQATDSPAPIQAAAERDKYGIGYNIDMYKVAPKTVLTSAVWNWGPYFVETVKNIKEGTWENQRYQGSMANGAVDITRFNPVVPEDVKKLVEDKKQEVKEGNLEIYFGPVRDQKGRLRISDGQKMSDMERKTMDWFVEGIDGTIPEKK